MSVILTACRHSRQKAIAKALKKKADKKKEKREAAMCALEEKLGVNDVEGENNVKIWTFLLNGEPTSVVLHRDSLQVACNGEIVDSTSDFCHCGATITFPVGRREGQITTSASEKEGMTFTLSIDGSEVPAMSLMDGREESSLEDSQQQSKDGMACGW